MGVDIETLIREVQALPPDDQRRVREALDQTAPVPALSDPAEEAFERELVEAGVLRKRQPPDSSSVARPRQLVHVQGKPLSETIIEDRR